jgi:pimeloyl-ACP methyl ester carboxylesterase/DNA-binding CsgD family transcriptional regulator
VRHDRRGCGLSDWDVPPVGFTDWVTDLEAVVAAHGGDRFALLGVSDGAAVALAFAARHPERVSRLVLHGAWGRPGARTTWGQPADTTFDDLREAATSAPVAARMRQVEDQVDLAPLLGRVRCPTLLLHAERDPEVPLAEAAWLAAQLADARLVPLDSDRHLPRASEAAWSQWLREVRGFLPGEPDGSSPLATLTPREREVLDLLAQGRDNATIADTLGLGIKTVRNHVSNVYRKLHTGTRERTAACARDAGFGRTFRPGTWV